MAFPSLQAKPWTVAGCRWRTEAPAHGLNSVTGGSGRGHGETKHVVDRQKHKVLVEGVSGQPV